MLRALTSTPPPRGRADGSSRPAGATSRQLGEPRGGAAGQTRRARGSRAPALPLPSPPRSLSLPPERTPSPAGGAVSLTPPTRARPPIPASPLCAGHPYPRYPPSTHAATRSEALLAPRCPRGRGPRCPAGRRLLGPRAAQTSSTLTSRAAPGFPQTSRTRIGAEQQEVPASGLSTNGRQGRGRGRRRKRPSDEGTSRRRVSSSCCGAARRTARRARRHGRERLGHGDDSAQEGPHGCPGQVQAGAAPRPRHPGAAGRAGGGERPGRGRGRGERWGMGPRAREIRAVGPGPGD